MLEILESSNIDFISEQLNLFYKNPPLKMSKYVDKFFSVLPFLILAYHLFALLWSNAHISPLIHIAVTYLFSGVLKMFFKCQRRIKSYAFREWPIPRALNALKSHYGFPSSHSMFYFRYLLLFPSLLTIIIMSIGMYSRVMYQHHTYKEVLWGIIIVILIEMGIRMIFGI